MRTCVKKPFDSRPEASRSIRVMGKRKKWQDMEAYWCPTCQKWHIRRAGRSKR